MDKKILIGNLEMITILINMICAKIFLSFPRDIAENSGTAGWIVAIYVSMLSFIGFFIISKLYKKFIGKDLLDIAELIGGAFGRIFVGIILILYLVFSASVILREFVEDMKTIALNLSPVSYVSAFFIIGMIVAAYYGIEAISRIHAITVPIIACGFIIILIGVMPYINFDYLLPILGNGASKIFIDGCSKVSIFTELIYLFLLFPFIEGYKNFKKVGYSALGFSSFFLILASVFYLSVISYPNALERLLPIYHMARLISYGSFFQRVESIFMIIWAFGGLLYLAVNFFFALYIFKKTFNLMYYRPLIPAFAIIIYCISLIPSNVVIATDLETKIIDNWGWLLTFGFTIILLIIGQFIKSKEKEAKT